MKHNKPKGELSDKARKRIENAINWLLFKSNPKPVYNREHDKVYFFRLNFITLTLPSKQIHTDQEVTAVCLNNFLNIIRKEAKVEDYMWRAEAQANGNIHYHLTTNKFMHWREVRRWWNSSVNLLGYVDRFENKFHHKNPPSTEIRKVKHIRKLAGYLSKYMAKEKSFQPIGELRLIGGKKIEVLYSSKLYKDEKAYMKQGKVIGSVLSDRVRKIDARLWSCSQSISKCKPFKVSQNSIQWEAIRELSHSTELYKRAGDYVDSYYGNVIQEVKKISAGLYNDLLQHAKGRSVSEQFTDDKVLQYM